MRSYHKSHARLMRIWNYNQPASTLLRARGFLRRFPQAATVWSLLGRLLTTMARYSEARSAVATSLRLRAETGKAPIAWTYVTMGDSYEQAGDFETALAWYRRALELNSDDADIYFELGYLLEQSGRLDEAEELLRQPRKCTEGDADEPWVVLARVLRSKGRLAEAERCLRKAIKINADNPRAKRVLADVRTVLADQRRKIRDRSVAISSADAHEQMNQAWHNDKPAHNVRLAGAYLAQCPDSAAVWLSLGSELNDLSLYEEARDALRISIRLCEESGDPPYHIALIEMGQSYRWAGNYATARTWLSKAVEVEPENAGVHIFLGALLAKSGQFEEAKAAHRRGTTCDEGCPDEAWHNIGLVLRSQERFAEAADCFERALAIDCNYTAAQDALADVTLAIRVTGRRYMTARPARADLAAIG
jgi:tetratricopeptide (TPR) repeat protein